MSKRKAPETEDANEVAIHTPTSKRTRRTLEQTTPLKKTPIKASGSVSTKDNDQTPKASKVRQGTPKSIRTKNRDAYTTPQKPVDPDGKKLYVVPNADRSARRRSAKNLIQQTVTGELSDEDLGDSSLAQEITREDEVGSEDEVEEQGTDTAELQTLSKPRAKTKRKRSPTPPTDLAPHERYFYDNRSAVVKTSMNTLSSNDLTSHAAYHEAISKNDDPHQENIDDLHSHHVASFPLWAFELSQQFSLCLYGYGSKKEILQRFASYLHEQSAGQPLKVMVINGMHPDVNLKGILTTMATAILPAQSTKLPTQPQQLATLITTYLSNSSPAPRVYILISVLHTKALSTPQSLAILSQLASHPSIHLVATADNPSFPILFPTQLRATFNFLFHDTTTFKPYDMGTADSELSTVVDNVLELIGRKTSQAAGREGIRWVLKSLPENARGLYRILVSEILSAAAEGSAPAFDIHAEEERPLGEDVDLDATPAVKARSRKRKDDASSNGLPGIDAKMLYQKAVEEFLCSSEMMFWSLLKEFVDHRMVIVRKERGLTGGGEMLGVEIGKEELEGVLEDLME